MDAIFISSKYGEIFDPHRLLLHLTDKINIKRSDKYIALSNLSIYYTWKKSYENSKLKISALIWNEEFELPDGSYSVSDIHDYFEYILIKYGEKTDNPSIRIYVNKIENRILLKLKLDIILNF